MNAPSSTAVNPSPQPPPRNGERKNPSAHLSPMIGEGQQLVASLPGAASSEVLQVLEAYLAELERGVPPHPDELLARHPDLAEPLKAYLASLEFLHRAEALAARGIPSSFRRTARSWRVA